MEVASSATAYTISGLDKVSYDVAVAAVNFIAPGAWSEAKASPPGLKRRDAVRPCNVVWQFIAGV